MAQFKKTCRECGKEITVANSRYCYCSAECRNEYIRKYRKGYVWHGQPKKRPHKTILCGICGKEVERMGSGRSVSQRRFHEDCVLMQAIESVKRGDNYGDSPQMQRARCLFGYSKAEIVEIIAESGETIEAKCIECGKPFARSNNHFKLCSDACRYKRLLKLERNRYQKSKKKGGETDG